MTWSTESNANLIASDVVDDDDRQSLDMDSVFFAGINLEVIVFGCSRAKAHEDQCRSRISDRHIQRLNFSAGSLV